MTERLHGYGRAIGQFYLAAYDGKYMLYMGVRFPHDEYLVDDLTCKRRLTGGCAFRTGALIYVARETGDRTLEHLDTAPISKAVITYAREMNGTRAMVGIAMLRDCFKSWSHEGGVKVFDDDLRTSVQLHSAATNAKLQFLAMECHNDGGPLSAIETEASVDGRLLRLRGRIANPIVM